MDINAKPEVVYVLDSYCGWCYGFSPLVNRFVAGNQGRVAFRAISGGLFVGDRSKPIGHYPHIPGANARIAELTGVVFGAAYEQLLADGRFVLDSVAAGAGVAALRHQAPERSIELAGRVQEHFYVRGLSLSAPATFASVASEAGLDPDRTLELLASGEAQNMALSDFTEARQLGVTSYPTLLVVQGGARIQLPATGSTVPEMTGALDAALAQLA